MNALLYAHALRGVIEHGLRYADGEWTVTPAVTRAVAQRDVLLTWWVAEHPLEVA